MLRQIQGLGEVMRQWIDSKTYTPVTIDACTPEQLAAAAERNKRKEAAFAEQVPPCWSTPFYSPPETCGVLWRWRHIMQMV